MRSDNETKLKQTLSRVLGVSEDTIDDDSSMDTLPAWDSVMHLNLILVLEEQFGVSFTEEQSFEIVSYPLIKLVLEEHGIDFSH